MPDYNSPNQTIPDQNTTASTQPVQPVATPLSHEELGPMTIKPTRGNKKMLWVLIGLLVVVLLGGGALAYAIVNKPENVLADALKTTLKAKTGKIEGTLKYSSTQSGAPTYNVDFKLEGNEEASKTTATAAIDMKPAKFNVGGSLISTKTGDSYLKIDDAKQILVNLSASWGNAVPGLEQALAPLVEKVDNKWIKFSAKELSSMSATADTECSEKLSKTKLSDAEIDKIVGSFKKHMFVNAKEVLKDESVNGRYSAHYKLGLDVTKAKLFVAEVKDLDSFKNVKSCFSESKFDKDTEKDLTQNPPVVEVWIDKWSHEPTRFVITAEDKDNKATIRIEANLVYGQSVAIDVPTKDITPFKELQDTYMNLFQSMMPSATSGIDSL